MPDDTLPPPTEASTHSASPGATFAQIGGFKLEAGSHELRVSFPDASSSSPTTIGIDSLSLVRLHAGRYASLADALNNDGITTEGGQGGLFQHNPELPAPGSTGALSSTKLATVGIKPGQGFPVTFTPSGESTPVTTTFDIPSALTSGEDNVIAAGQQIAVPANSGVDHVDFLVGSSCGTVPFDSKVQFTLTHQPAGSEPIASTTAMIPSFSGVPDWRLPVVNDPELVPIAINGSVQGNPAAPRAGNVYLYVIEIDVDPANRDHELTEVTLPRTAPAFTQTCDDGPQLHVLGMKTREDSATP